MTAVASRVATLTRASTPRRSGRAAPPRSSPRGPLGCPRPQGRAQRVEIAQDLPVRAGHRRLVVGDAALPAEGAHDRLRRPQLVARQRREEVMLDLVVQPAIPVRMLLAKSRR